MNIPTTLEAVTVIVILFIPGYIFLQFTKNAVAFIPQAVDALYFLAVITWGGLIHLSFYRWTQHVLDWYLAGELAQHEGWVGLWAFVVLIGAPLMAGLLGSWVIQLSWADEQLKRIGMDYVSRTPTAWNYSTKLGPRWVRVHLKDGTVIAGSYGPGSFADDADEKDIYLAQVYNLDDKGDFADEVAYTAGVWIAHEQISHVMFYYPKDQEATSGDQDQHGTEADPQTEA